MWKNKIMPAALAGMLLLSGCESVELEERSFPLAVGIDLQKGKEEGKDKLIVSFDFPDLAQISEKGKTTDTPMAMSLEGVDLYHVEKSYENNTNRILDYNHIKAVVLGDGLTADAKKLRGLLKAWEQEDTGARNITLFVGKSSAAEVLSLTEETEGSMGKYLEEMMESQEDFRPKKIATVGNLINQWHNRNELLLLPVLSEKGNRPAVSGYAAFQNFEYAGILTVEEAMYAFLCQNLLETFLCEPNQEEAAEISGIRVQTTIEAAQDGPVVTTSISGKGSLKTGQTSSMGQQYQIEQRMQRRLTADLQECAKKLQEEYGIDVTNSYVSLGGLNRELYSRYKDRPEEYNRDVQHVFEVDIEIF